MALTLLRPHILSYKNRLFSRKQGVFNRELLALLLSICLAGFIYAVDLAFLQSIIKHPSYSPVLLENLMRMFLFSFFMLLAFSNLIVALSTLFLSQDISLLLVAPVSSPRLFAAKLIETIFVSSWIFFLFAVPVCAAYGHALGLPASFYIICLLSAIPYVLIPAALAFVFVVIFVNLIPPYRMRDLLVVIAFCCSAALLYLGHTSPEYFPEEEQKMNELVAFLKNFHDPQPVWMPSRWIADLLSPYLGTSVPRPELRVAMLIGTSLAITALAFLAFDSLFQRGLAVSSQGSKNNKVYGSEITALLGRICIPFQPQLRAMAYKEARMFIRDTTQALQLMMLLLLTFMYLYNFRALRSASHFSEEGLVWWQVILSVANVIFGACVVSAIATRFVFPSISLEGRAFPLLRSTPLSILQLLQYKFITWLLPMLALAIILLVSGSMAIQASNETIAATVAVAVALSVGITGLGIGAGAYYARFDWESPAQVTASFGSLVFMLLSLTNILFSAVPILFLFVLTSVPEFAGQMTGTQYALGLLASFALLFSINALTARHALSAGAASLRDREA